MILSCRLIFCLALLGLTAADANAAEQRLSDLSYLRHSVQHGTVLIETRGAAKLLISFVSPAMARIRVAPAGGFPPNASPAVAKTAASSEAATVVEDGIDALIVHQSGLALRIDKQPLRVDAYEVANQHYRNRVHYCPFQNI